MLKDTVFQGSLGSDLLKQKEAPAQISYEHVIKWNSSWQNEGGVESGLKA